MKLRGYLALGILCVGFLISDLVQRLLIAPWVKLRPSRRIPVLGRWINAMATLVLTSVGRVGGASIRLPPRVVPCEPGTLIVMNHQSVLDIPLAVSTVAGGYPRIVTRERYRRFVPLISHMVRLYQYPVVDPSAKPGQLRNTLESLGEEGRASDVPIVIFPEGTRTRDGEIGRFRKRGLLQLLSQRPWRIYLFVGDGYWRTAKLRDFLAGMGHIDGTIDFLGSVEWTGPGADAEPFIEDLRQRLVDGLARLRSGPADGRLPRPPA